MPTRTQNAAPTSSSVMGQSAILFTGYAIMQGCAFARNILLAYWLSKGDFGITAALTLVLQVLETLSDLGADRLIVQAKDGDDPDLMANIHTILVARGLLSGLIIVALAWPTAMFFNIEHATWAFAAAAIVPVLKGFMHIDSRRMQRNLNNAPFMAAEALPQVITLAVAIPILYSSGDYHAAIWLAIVQAVVLLATTHGLAYRPYKLGINWPISKRIIAFGWPIWLSAIPLMAVYYTDRAIIGRLFGMEELATYTVAFLVTMVPAVILGRGATALILPMLSHARPTMALYTRHYRAMCEIIIVLASLYAMAMITIGDQLISYVFGQRYAGLASLVSILTIVWTLRIIQCVPGTAMLASADTKALLKAGSLRATAIIPAIFAALYLGSVEAVAIMGIAGELLSTGYVSWATRAISPRMSRIFLMRCLYLASVIIAALAIKLTLPPDLGLLPALLLTTLTISAAFVLAMFVMPALRRYLEEAFEEIQLFGRKRGAGRQPPQPLSS